jgi:putative ABC transport system substrate-binding protein
MQSDRRRRRAFITLLGGAAAWPLAARAQQPEQTRRIAALMALAADDPDGPPRFAAFLQGLQKLGWVEGRNARIETRWAAGLADRFRAGAAELVASAPNVVLANGSPAVASLQQLTRTIPIVFVNVIDPVGAGFVPNLARPGGNTTGFTLFEYSISGKWIEILKQIAPRLKRVGVLRDSTLASGIGQFAVVQAVAPSFGVELTPIGIGDPGEIERGVAAFARESNGGLIVTLSTLAVVHRDLIIALAARHGLPTVYGGKLFATSGGLISYGPDLVEPYHRAAGYVDRILKGEKPAELPVQAPVKYELVINVKTAKALGLEVPVTMLALADEVIE